MKAISLVTALLLSAGSALAAQLPPEADACGMALDDLGEARLSPDIQARIAVLRDYGPRFEPAIRLIREEARRPIWRCGHDMDELETEPAN